MGSHHWIYRCLRASLLRCSPPIILLLVVPLYSLVGAACTSSFYPLRGSSCTRIEGVLGILYSGLLGLAR